MFLKSTTQHQRLRFALTEGALHFSFTANVVCLASRSEMRVRRAMSQRALKSRSAGVHIGPER
jgi:hypothetical protein